MLTGVLPELAQKHAAMETRLRAQGITFKVAPFGLLRTRADTAEILGYRQREYAAYVAALKKKNPAAVPTPINVWRKIASWGSSYHNYGGAFDVEITNVHGTDVHRTPKPAPIWSTDPKRAAALYETGMAAARHAGIAAGLARVHDDDPHFQLPYSLDEVRRMWETMTGKPNAGASPLPVLLWLVVLGGAAVAIARSSGFKSWH